MLLAWSLSISGLSDIEQKNRTIECTPKSIIQPRMHEYRIAITRLSIIYNS